VTHWHERCLPVGVQQSGAEEICHGRTGHGADNILRISRRTRLRFSRRPSPDSIAAMRREPRNGWDRNSSSIRRVSARSSLSLNPAQCTLLSISRSGVYRPQAVERSE
jgi:hypothetical protein